MLPPLEIVLGGRLEEFLELRCVLFKWELLFYTVTIYLSIYLPSSSHFYFLA